MTDTTQTNDDLPPALPPVVEGEAPPAAADAAPTAPKKKVAAKAEPAPVLSDKVTIIIDEPNGAPSNQQFFGHKGVGYLITFGEPVIVPSFFPKYLDELVTTRTIPTEGGGFVERSSLRFSYRVVG